MPEMKLPEDLKRHAILMYRSVSDALAAYMKDHGALRRTYSARSESSLIHDYIKQEVKKHFASEEKRNLFLGYIGKYCFKVKKLDTRLKTRNQQTQQVMDFLEQRMLDIFDHAPTVNLHLGYQKNPIELRASRVWLVRPEGRKVDWMWDLSAEHADTVAVPFRRIQAPSPTPLSRRVRPKKSASKKDETNL